MVVWWPRWWPNANGSLSADQFAVIAAANTPARAARFGEAEELLVQQCITLDLRDTRIVVQHWCEVVDQLLDADLEVQRQRCVVEGVDSESRPVLVAHLDGRVFASRSGSAPANGRRPRPLFTVTVGNVSMPRLCSSGSGLLLASGDLVPLLDAAMLETVVFADRSTVISVSKQRTFRGVIRRAIQVRDQHCRHPSGCDVAAERCDVDHIVPAARGGPTSQFCGVIGCDAHHRVMVLRQWGWHTPAPCAAGVVDRVGAGPLL